MRMLLAIVLMKRNGSCSTIEDCRSEEHTSELQSQSNLVCRLLLEKKNNTISYLLGAPTTSGPSWSVYMRAPVWCRPACSRSYSNVYLTSNRAAPLRVHNALTPVCS